MSLYGNKIKIDGVVCGMIIRGAKNGEYQAVFEREFASLEQIEAINWKQPSLEGPCGLPAGYGFEVTRIDYHMGDKSFRVSVKVLEQYLGDVTGYQAQIDGLEADKVQLETDLVAKEETIQELSSQLAEADETAIALYEELAAAQADADSEEVQE